MPTWPGDYIYAIDYRSPGYLTFEYYLFDTRGTNRICGLEEAERVYRQMSMDRPDLEIRLLKCIEDPDTDKKKRGDGKLLVMAVLQYKAAKRKSK